MNKTTPDLAGALAAMKVRTRGPRVKSPVYAWLAARYDGLAAAFSRQPASWTALAKYLADGGIMNADGAPPSPAAVRSSWLRVEADIARKRASRGSRAPAVERPVPASVKDRTDDNLADDQSDAPDFSNFVKG